MTLTTGTVVGGRYTIQAPLGRGGMADVYRAVDGDGDVVAVKVLRLVDAEQARRFALEARTLARLDHPGVVRFCDAGEHDGAPFLVMDLVDGPTLSERLRQGPLPLDQVIDIGAVLSSALAHAHHLGIVHRDVKPGNVLLDGDGTPRLADFGIARLVDGTSLTASGMTVGTAAYLAPEQVDGREVGPPADVYALGLVLLEGYTGRPAYPGTVAETAMARLVRAPDVPEGLPAWWRELLTGMTAPEPDRRPSASDVHARLTGATDDTQTTAEHAVVDATAVLPPVVPAPAPPPRRRPGLAVAVVAFAVGLLAVVLLALALDDGGDSPPPRTDLPAELDDALDHLQQEVEE